MSYLYFHAEPRYRAMPYMLPPGYTLHHEAPSPSDYIFLRTISGLSEPPAQAITSALSSSVHTILVRVEKHPMTRTVTPIPPTPGEPVALCRLVGDGHLFLQLVDVAVHPSHRGKGLGKAMLLSMMAWVDDHAPDAYVSLIADPGPVATKLYESVGFVTTEGTGMKRARWGR